MNIHEIKMRQRVTVEANPKGLRGPLIGEYFVDAVDHERRQVRLVPAQSPDQYGYWVDVSRITFEGVLR